MAIAVDKLADYNSMNCRWANHGEYIGNTYSRQALAMVWDYAETVPVVTTSGNWMGAIDWSIRSIESTAASSSIPATVVRGDAAKLPFSDDSLDCIVTDPPYYDAISYAELSDFFYVWLKRSLSDVFPEHFRTPLTPKAREMECPPKTGR